MIDTQKTSPSEEVAVSVVVASIESERRIRDCLQSIIAAANGRAVEIIVVDASRDRTAQIIRLSFPQVNLVSLPAGTLAPNLWAKGLATSHGRAVAFTTAYCVVPNSWITDLCSALDAGAAGAGGPISLAPDSSLRDVAIYFLRYSAFLPGGAKAAYETSEIAGDNSMYKRSALDPHSEMFADGFWEVELHRELKAAGEHLSIVPSAKVAFGESSPLRVISRHRFAHGKHFGSWRRATGTSVARIVFAAPVVPFALLVRAARRARAADAGLGRLILASPIFLWLGACWAFGETAGAMQGFRVRDANRR